MWFSGRDELIIIVVKMTVVDVASAGAPAAAVQLANRQTVCVTGAAGYIASWLVKRLLEKGYTVKGTVRNPGMHRRSHICSSYLLLFGRETWQGIYYVQRQLIKSAGFLVC